MKITVRYSLMSTLLSSIEIELLITIGEIFHFE